MRLERIRLPPHLVEGEGEPEFTPGFGEAGERLAGLLCGTVFLLKIGAAVDSLRGQIWIDLKGMPANVDGKPWRRRDDSADKLQADETLGARHVADQIDRNLQRFRCTHARLLLGSRPTLRASIPDLWRRLRPCVKNHDRRATGSRRYRIESIQNRRVRFQRFRAECRRKSGSAYSHHSTLRSAKAGLRIYRLILDYIGHPLTNQASSDR